MPVEVRFRFNKVTGEVEEFVIDDGDRTLPEAEHDRTAQEVGREIARRPLIRTAPVSGAARPEPAPESAVAEREPPPRRRQRS